MGMFDYIKNELFCPFCGTKQPADSFQTKSFNSMMNEINIDELEKDDSMRCYSECIKCEKYIELIINGK